VARRTDADAEREQGHEDQHEALERGQRGSTGDDGRRRTKTTELMQVAPSDAVQLSALVGVVTAPVAVAPLLATVIVCVTVSVAVDMAAVVDAAMLRWCRGARTRQSETQR